MLTISLPLPHCFELIPVTALEGVTLSLAGSAVQAGLPSPAGDEMDEVLDLHEHLIRNPATTFLLRVQGDSMRDANIHEGDVLIVDCALQDYDNRIVVACLNGDFTVKRFERSKGKGYLLPANPAFQQMEITSEMDFSIWGVVIYIIHKP